MRLTVVAALAGPIDGGKPRELSGVVAAVYAAVEEAVQTVSDRVEHLTALGMAGEEASSRAAEEMRTAAQIAELKASEALEPLEGGAGPIVAPAKMAPALTPSWPRLPPKHWAYP